MSSTVMILFLDDCGDAVGKSQVQAVIHPADDDAFSWARRKRQETKISDRLIAATRRCIIIPADC